jgi:hypothetical protein
MIVINKEDHKVTDPRFAIVCSACGRVWGEHSFDSSCRTWATLVWASSVVRQGGLTRELAVAADEVEGAPRSYALMAKAEAEKEIADAGADPGS